MLYFDDMRSEAQIRYDEEHKHPCAGCGKLVYRVSTRCGSCASKQNRSWLKVKYAVGADHRNWKGGRFKQKNGYIFVKAYGHPRATNKGGYVFEHILVWEQAHKRSVPEGHVIHHLNGIKDDNRIDNLLCLPKKKHAPHTLLWAVQKRVKVLEEALSHYNPPTLRW